jgi:hypothetical protein
MDLVHEGISAESSMKDVAGQIIYQGESFAAKIQKLLARRILREEIPRRERCARRPSLAALFPEECGRDKRARDRSIQEAYLQYGYRSRTLAST